MVLEAGERPLDTRLQLALEQAVADHPRVSRDGVEREDAGPRLLRAADVAVEGSEELVAAADRENGGPVGDRRAQRIALARQIRRDQRLLAVLAASDVVHVVTAGLDAVADSDRLDDELDSPPRGSPLEHGDVAAVGVDVQVVGIQMPDANLHAARSQYRRA
jgi:hypothetical protein